MASEDGGYIPPELQQGMEDISPELFEEYNQKKLEEKLGDPGFFKFAQTTADKKGLTLAASIEKSGGVDAMVGLAEKYDTEIKPVLGKFNKFLSEEWLGKMQLIKGQDVDAANASIEVFLGAEAAKDPDGFVSKYTELFNRFDELNIRATNQENALKGLIRENGAGDIYGLAKKGAEFNMQKAQLEAKRTSEAGKYEDNIDGLEKRRAAEANPDKNRWSRFKNKVFSLGRNDSSDAEMAIGEQQYDTDVNYFRSDNKISDEIEVLGEKSDQIKTSLQEKTNLDDQILGTKKKILADFSGLTELRDQLLEAAKKAIADKRTPYDVDNAASTLNEMGNVWENTGDATYEKGMDKLLTAVFTREVEDSSRSEATAINPARLQEFNKFLMANIQNDNAKKLMKDVIEEKLKSLPAEDKNSPKGVQLSLMLRRVDGVKPIKNTK